MRPLRVLQVIAPTAIYGAERWILAMTAHLDRSRVVSELAIPDEGEAAADELIELFRAKIGSAHKIASSGAYDPRTVTRLARLTRERGIDILHSHGYKSDLIALAAARLAGVSVITTPHGFGSDIGLKLRGFIWLGTGALRFFDQVVPLSDQLAREVTTAGVREDRMTLIENGVDLGEIDASSAAEASGPNERGSSIGYVGQLIPRKRVQHVLEAFDRLAGNYPDLRLVIAGDGPERGALVRRASELRTGDRIEFKGFVRERLNLMRTFDLFLLGSSSEGIPRCLMESMALSVPAVAYDIEGVDSLVIDGVTGRLVPDGDLDAFTAALDSLLANADLRARLGRSARERIRTRFSAHRMAREYETLFERLHAGKMAVARRA